MENDTNDGSVDHVDMQYELQSQIRNTMSHNSDHNNYCQKCLLYFSRDTPGLNFEATR